MNLLATIVLLAQFPAPSASTRPPSERLTDAIGVSLSAVAGGLLGAIAGVYLGVAIGDDDDEDLAFGVALGAGMFAGGALGGGAVFDWVSDGDGSVIALALGALGGALAGSVIGSRANEPDRIATFIVMTAIGAGIGYALVDADSPSPSFGAIPNGDGGLDMIVGLTGAF